MAINPEREIEVIVSAGEASGDAYAAHLIQTLRERWDSEAEGAKLVFGGLAGARTEALGVPLIRNTSKWGAIGFTEAARLYLRVVGSYYRMKRYMATHKPGLFVPIDFGYVNIRLSRHAKNRGWKVLYFVPPGSWRRDRQGADLPVVTDAIATPFEWSEEILKGYGANAYWFGHPIRQLVDEQAQKVAKDCPREKQLLGILPGSRKHEIDSNLPLIAKIVEPLDIPLEMALTPNADIEQFKQHWAKYSSKPAIFTRGQTANILLRSSAAIVCSGTATLEAALCDCPMVVIYELPTILRLEMKVRMTKRPKFISLPNIMLDKDAVPEHVEFWGISADLVRSQILELLEEGPARKRQMDMFAELKQLLGPPDAIDRTAQMAMSMLREML